MDIGGGTSRVDQRWKNIEKKSYPGKWQGVLTSPHLANRDEDLKMKWEKSNGESSLEVIIEAENLNKELDMIRGSEGREQNIILVSIIVFIIGNVRFSEERDKSNRQVRIREEGLSKLNVFGGQ